MLLLSILIVSIVVHYCLYFVLIFMIDLRAILIVAIVFVIFHDLSSWKMLRISQRVYGLAMTLSVNDVSKFWDFKLLLYFLCFFLNYG